MRVEEGEKRRAEALMVGIELSDHPVLAGNSERLRLRVDLE